MIEAAALHELAHAVRRLSPSHRDPERFHLDKSEIERALRRLAREAGRADQGATQKSLGAGEAKTDAQPQFRVNS